MIKRNGYKFDFQGNEVLAFNDQGTSGISEWTTFPFLNKIVKLIETTYGVQVYQEDGTVDIITGGYRLSEMFAMNLIPAPNQFWEGTNVLRSVEPGGKYVLFVSRNANINVSGSPKSSTRTEDLKRIFQNLGAQVEVAFVDGRIDEVVKLTKV